MDTDSKNSSTIFSPLLTNSIVGNAIGIAPFSLASEINSEASSWERVIAIVLPSKHYFHPITSDKSTTLPIMIFVGGMILFSLTFFAIFVTVPFIIFC